MQIITLMEEFWVYICLCIACFLFTVVVNKQEFRKKQGAYQNINGQKMKEVRGDTRVRRFTHGLELSNEGYNISRGEPYIIRNGGRREVVLCKPEHLKQFFQKGGRGHMKTPDGNLGYFFHRLLGQCLGAQSGADWARIRSAFDPTFTRLAAMALFNTFRNALRDWLGALPSCSKASPRGDGAFSADVSDLCIQLPLKLIAYSLYGKTLVDKNFAELENLVHIREQLIPYTFLNHGTISKLYSYLPTQANSILTDFAKRFRAFNLRMIVMAEETKTECPIREIWQGTREKDGISISQFLHTIDEILFENIDVASAALSHLLVNVGSDTAVQEKLRLEASPYLEKSGEESIEAYLGRSDTYLELCCAESRRLCPVLWYTFPERAPVDMVIDGFLVPANTDVTIDCKRINIHSPIWTTTVTTTHEKQEVNGFDYCPARFGQLSRSDYRYSELVYGGGARKCIGQNFANLVMRILLLEIISTYHITVKLRAWESGFRRDRFTPTPKSQAILFKALA